MFIARAFPTSGFVRRRIDAESVRSSKRSRGWWSCDAINMSLLWSDDRLSYYRIEKSTWFLISKGPVRGLSFVPIRRLLKSMSEG